MADNSIKNPRKIRNDLTQEYVRSILDYNPVSGVLTWKWRHDISDSRNRLFAGKAAGYEDGSAENGYYINIHINGGHYKAHRIIWLYVHGEWLQQIDHKNTNGLDNRIDNLRPATPSQNSFNRKIRKDNKSGFKGVFFRKETGKYRISISKEGKRYHLGQYDTAEEAYAVYCKASAEIHGEFGRIK